MHAFISLSKVQIHVQCIKRVDCCIPATSSSECGCTCSTGAISSAFVRMTNKRVSVCADDSLVFHAFNFQHVYAKLLLHSF